MRRQSRICALQILYQLDMDGQLGVATIPTSHITQACTKYFEHFGAPNDTTDADKQYAHVLVRGVVENLSSIDETVGQSSHHWKLGRMDYVDRNLLRLAVYEMMWCKDVPRNVCINEAIEVAKRFCGNDAGSFVNGILDKIPNIK